MALFKAQFRFKNLLSQRFIKIRLVSGLTRTHMIINQSTPYENYNAYTSNICLTESVEREGGSWANEHLSNYGKICGSSKMLELSKIASEHRPVLSSHDRYGNREGFVCYDSSYHLIMESGISNGVHSFSWKNREKPGNFAARAALHFMHSQLDHGTGCPLTMTHAAVASLSNRPHFKPLIEKIITNNYNPKNIPISKKSGITIGMSMTEKQGGTDVKANTTIATPIYSRGEGCLYTLIGHKWFTSAPNCDAFLTLAYTENGLSCFLVTRWLEDGHPNEGLVFMRLKNKLGDHSNASSEVEYNNAVGTLVGEEGQGLRVIMEMVSMTRFDCAAASSALMFQATQHAIHHLKMRKTFGEFLINQPIMKDVVVDMLIECEASTVFVFRLARAMENSTEKTEKDLARIGLAIAKYYICKRTPNFCFEALECHGGNGYVEDFPLARYYRQAPLNSIWEGSGNVIALDVLRAIKQKPEIVDTLLNEIKLAEGINERFDKAVKQLELEVTNIEERHARKLTSLFALCLQGSCLLRFGNPAIAEGFCQARLSSNDYGTIGTSSCNFDGKIIEEILSRYIQN